MIDQKVMNDLMTAYPQAAHVIGSASALVDMTPYALPVISGSAGYVTFTLIVADHSTKTLTALPMIFQKEKIPTITAGDPDVTFLTQPDFLSAIQKYGQVVDGLSPISLKQSLPEDSGLWEAPSKMGSAYVVFLYQPGNNDLPLNSIPSNTGTTVVPESTSLVWKAAAVVIPDTVGISAG